MSNSDGLDEHFSWFTAGYGRSAGYSFAIFIGEAASRSTPGSSMETLWIFNATSDWRLSRM
jgi:hypothetical protein